MAHDSLIARQVPQYIATGGNATAADLSEIALYAGTYGNYAAETSTARTGRSGAALWNGLIVTETDTGLTWLYTSGWQLLGHGSLYWRGDAYTTLSATLPTAYANVSGLSVAATTIGGRVRARVEGSFLNNISGANRTANVKIMCDGVQVGDATQIMNVPFLASTALGTGFVLPVTHTPAAGAHTWTVQAQASVINAVNLATTFLTVEEFL